MFYRCALLSGVIFLAISSYAQIKEDFEADLLSWSGDTSDVIISQAGQLRLDAEGAGETWLYTAHGFQGDSGFWEFSVRMDFNPSGSNNLRVYLALDSVAGLEEGYFIMIGDTEDEISLYYQKDQVVEYIINGPDDLIDTSPVDIRVRVTYDGKGLWSLQYASGTSSYNDVGSGYHIPATQGKFFGFYYDYTSTRADKFYIDNVRAFFEPAIDTILVNNKQEVQVRFNQLVDNNHLIPANFGVSNLAGSKVMVRGLRSEQPRAPMVTLETDSLTEGEYELVAGSLVGALGGFVSDSLRGRFSYKPLKLTRVGTPTDSTLTLNFNQPLARPELVSSQFSITPFAGKFFLADYDSVGNKIRLHFEKRLQPETDYTGFLQGIENQQRNSLLDTTFVFQYLTPFLVDSIEILSAKSIRIDFSKDLDTLLLLNTNLVSIDGVETLRVTKESTASLLIEFSGDLPEGIILLKLEAVSARTGQRLEPAIHEAFYDQLELHSIAQTNENSFQLAFDQALSKLDMKDFSSPELGSPKDVKIVADSLVELQFAAQTYGWINLILPAFRNLPENSIISADTMSIFMESMPSPGALRFNELMIDPVPSIGLPEVEYIELHNPGELPINTINFSINGQKIDSMQLGPGEYVVVVDDSDRGFLRDVKIATVASFGSLTNSGEKLLLLGPDGQHIDSLRYTDQWYDNEEKADGGYSLERRSTEFVCHSDYAWTVTQSSEGGTPGEMNASRDDSSVDQQPGLKQALAENNKELSFFWNRPMLTDTGRIFSLDGEPAGSRIFESAQKIRMSLFDSLLSEKWRTFVLSGFMSCEGTITTPDTLSIYYDDQPPRLTRAGFLSANELFLIFHEELDEGSAETEENFKFGARRPEKAILQDSARNRIHFSFNSNLEEMDSAITIAHLQDTMGNHLPPVSRHLRYQQPLISAVISSTRSVDIQVKDKITFNSDTGNYLIPEVGRAETVQFLPGSERKARIFFQQELRDNKTYLLYINELRDSAGHITPSPASILYKDTRAPKVSRILAVDSVIVEVVFNEAVKALPAINILNYTIDGKRPEEIVFVNDSVTRIALSDTLPREKYVKAVVRRQEDIHGNQMAGEDVFQIIYDSEFPRLIDHFLYDESTIQLEFHEPVRTDSTTFFKVTAEDTVSVEILPHDSSSIHLISKSPFPQDEALSVDFVRISDRHGNSIEDTVQININTFDPIIVDGGFVTTDIIYLRFSHAMDTSRSVNGKVQIEGEKVSAYEWASKRKLIIGLPSSAGQRPTYEIQLQDWVSDKGVKMNEDSLILRYEFPFISAAIHDPITLKVQFNTSLSHATAESFFTFSEVLNVSFVEKDQKSVLLILADSIPVDSTFYLYWQGLEGPYSRPVDGGTAKLYFDRQPPDISSYQAISDEKIEFYFSEPIELNQISVDNFQLVPGGIRTLLTISEERVVFEVRKLQPMKPYSLWYHLIEDTVGNVGEEGSFEFTYIRPNFPEPQDLVINEVMIDPGLENALLPYEYVELYNTSKDTFDLNLLYFGDRIRQVPLPDYKIYPGQYIAIADRTAGGWVDSLNVALIENFPTLNNSDDSIYLKTIDEELIDYLVYDARFYQTSSQNHQSLERKNPYLGCDTLRNWAPSISSYGGTPAKENSVFSAELDSAGPKIISHELFSSNRMKLIFDEKVEEAGITVRVNGTSAEFTALNVEGSMIEVLFDRSLQAGLLYEFEVRGARDCHGNEGIMQKFSNGTGRTPRFNELIITEVMADPEPERGLPVSEYIEIYNRTDEILSLSRVFFSDSVGQSGNLSGNLFPGQYLTLVPGSYPDSVPHIRVQPWRSLSNSGEVLMLQADRDLVFSLRYSDDWYEDEAGGLSLEMISPASPCFENGNWTSSIDERGGTPGRQNSVHEPQDDTLAAYVAGVALAENRQVRLSFSEKLHANSELDVIVSDQFLTIVARDSIHHEWIDAEIPAAIGESQKHQLVVTGIKDCHLPGQYSDTIDFVLPASGSPTIYVSEILFNPMPGSVDFIEVYNPSDKIFNLSSILFRDDEGKELPVSPYAEMIFPNQYMAITTDTTELHELYPSPGKKNLLKVDRLPAFNDDQGSVSLHTLNGEIIDSIYYEQDFHSSLLPSSEGVSLERITQKKSATGKHDWNSASSFHYYATPGYKNSSGLSLSTGSGRLTIEPKVFAPVGNRFGFSTYTSIKYSLEHDDLMSQVRIFNLQGQLIRVIANGKPVTSEGHFKWDGSDNNGKMAKPGRYLIHFEAYNREGYLFESKSTVVLSWNK